MLTNKGLRIEAEVRSEARMKPGVLYVQGPQGEPGAAGPQGPKGDSGDGIRFTTDDTLKLQNGVLSVNTAKVVEQDNTLPITSAAVYTEVGNINALLETI